MIPPEEMVTCTCCEAEFDFNEPERMRLYQALHREEQLHLWGSCAFLNQYFDDHPVAELYDTPWRQNPRIAHFCDDDCEQAYLYTGDFQYRECEGCARMVCEQNPANGWMWQFREHADAGNICLRCYETEILKDGQPRSDFEGDHIAGGMFFSGGNREPKAAGSEEVDAYQNFYVTDRVRAREYNRHALSLMDGGAKVITAYEAMAIGGLEGYITMLARLHRREVNRPISRDGGR